MNIGPSFSLHRLIRQRQNAAEGSAETGSCVVNEESTGEFSFRHIAQHV